MKTPVTAQQREAMSCFNDVVASFKAAMRNAGIEPKNEIIANGRLQRDHIIGHRLSTKNLAYILHLDDRPCGWFFNHKAQEGKTWTLSRTKEPMTDALKQQIQHAKDALKKERDEAHAKTKERAQWIWANSDLAIYHSYLEIKRVKPHGLKIYKGLLAIPLADEFGEIVNLQLIAPDGTKKYLTGGKKQGCFAIIGELTDVILVAEGFATAATLFEQTGKMTVIAFDAGNLLVVATVIKRKYPQTDIIIAGDNDASGIGQAKANEAAVAVGGKLLIPPNAGQDWNDYTNAHALAGGAA